MNTNLALGALLAALALAPASAQAPETTETQGMQEPQAPAPGAALKVPPAEIVAFIKANNDVEIKAARDAQERARTQEVKRFAKMMEEHHKDSNRQLKTAKADLGGSDAAEALEAKADQDGKTLKETDDSRFDEVYIAQQVEAHRSLLKAIDEALADRKVLGRDAALVSKTRGVVKKHLEEAERIKSSLGGR